MPASNVISVRIRFIYSVFGFQNYLRDDDDDEDEYDDDEVDEEEARTNRHLRLASTNAEKSQSWRGDNPLRANRHFAHLSGRPGHFFEHELKAQHDQRISMPFRYGSLTC